MTARNFQTAPLAVVGMACRFPGADGLQEYWELLHGGRSGISTFPAERLNPELYYHPDKAHPGTTYTRVGGIVPLRPIDRDICPMTDEFASRYDLGHLTMCEVAAAACRHAGYDPLDLPYRATGVYIGNTSGGTDLQCDLAYHTYAGQMAEILREVPSFAALPAAERENAIADVVASIRRDHPSRAQCKVHDLTPGAVATAITSLFGLTGPSLVTDAACAGSFVSLLLGAQALHQGRIDMALVGGAALRKWYELVLIAQAGTMSSNGSCPFDARADGLISSDGYAVIVIKTVARAEADGDRIWGVIRGLGMSSDGRGKSFWAPRQDGQVAAIRRAYEGGLDPSRLQYIEAHATSTRLGDAVEVRSLVESFEPHLRSRIPIASVKANIGHTLETAGMAGFIKTMLAMEHGIVPPAINYECPNPEIDWDSTPFYLPLQAQEWPEPEDGQPRRAGVNAFGVGGLNLHLVVDQHVVHKSRVSVTVSAPALDGLSTRNVTSGLTSQRALLAPAQEAEGHGVIAVIGAGSLFPGARTVDAFWELLVSGRDPKAEVPADRWNAEAESRYPGRQAMRITRPRGGFITDFNFDWKKHKIPPKQIAKSNPLQFMLLDATDQALADAGLGDDNFDRSRAGAVVGSIFAADFVSETFMGLRWPDISQRIAAALARRGLATEAAEQILESYRELLLSRSPGVWDDSGSMAPSTLASGISKNFDLRGGALTIDAGQTSSLAAVVTAVDLLQTGMCDVVVCAGAQRRGDLTYYEETALRGHLANGTLRAAFDIDTDGYLPGDGVGVLVLKRLPDARRDDNTIRAVIRGVGAASDHRFAEKAVRASVRQALRAGGIDGRDVGLVETGALGVAARDRIELSALAAELETAKPVHPVRIGSLSAQFGNTQGASGIASLLKAALCLEHGQLPATFGMHRPARLSGPQADVFDFALDSLPVGARDGKRSMVAGVTSYSEIGPDGAGGTAYQVLIEGGTRLMSQPAVEGAPSWTESPGGLASASDAIEAFVLDFAEEQTGFPQFALDLDVDLQSDLRLDAARRSNFLRELMARAGVSAPQPVLNSLRSLADVATFLREQAPTIGAAVPAASRRQASSAGAQDADSRTTTRHILRTVEAPLPAGLPDAPTFFGPALIVGQNAVGDALKERLVSLGVTVYDVPLDRGIEGASAEVDRLSTAGLAPHLFLVTGRDDDAGPAVEDEPAWQARRQAGVLLPFFVCQRWFAHVEQAGLVDRASIAVVTSLGGDFGLAGYSSAVEGGALAGLAKSLGAETAGRLKVKVVDAPPREPGKLIATMVLRELASGRPEVEVACVRGKRFVVAAVPQPAARLARQNVEPGGVWVVSGGGRGIGALLARELGGRFGAKLHLLGTRPEPTVETSWRNLSDEERKSLKKQVLLDARASGRVPREAWDDVERALELDACLEACRQAGIDVTYHVCDVSNRAALNEVLERIRQTHGPIYGIVHAAGLEAPCRFTKKQPQTVSRVLGAKVDGAANLMALTRKDPLAFFVGIGSAQGRFGASAQTDSSAASDMLCKLIARYRHERPACCAVAIDFSPWENVGTAAASVVERKGARFTPASEGLAQFVDELQTRCAETEVLFVEQTSGIFGDQLSLPSAERAARMRELETLIAESPLIDVVVPEADGGGTAGATYDPRVDPFLTGHRVEGVPLLPAVIVIESCSQAASILSGGKQVVGVRDMKLINGFRMEAERPYRATIRVELSGNLAACTLCGEFYGKDGRFVEPTRVYQSCIIELADGPISLGPADLSTQPTEWVDVPYPDDWRLMAGANSGTVYYGPELRCLKQIHHNHIHSWGRLIGPRVGALGGERRGRIWHTPPAVLDALFFINDLHASHHLGTRQLPHSIGRIRFARSPQPGEQCVAQASYRGREGRLMNHSVWMAGADGQVILTCDDLLSADLDYSLKDTLAERSAAS